MNPPQSRVLTPAHCCSCHADIPLPELPAGVSLPDDGDNAVSGSRIAMVPSKAGQAKERWLDLGITYAAGRPPR